MIELREVVEICTDHLVRQLEPSNAIGIFRFAADHNCMLLREAALRYVCTNFVQVSLRMCMFVNHEGRNIHEYWIQI